MRSTFRIITPSDYVSYAYVSIKTLADFLLRNFLLLDPSLSLFCLICSANKRGKNAVIFSCCSCACLTQKYAKNLSRHNDSLRFLRAINWHRFLKSFHQSFFGGERGEDTLKKIWNKFKVKKIKIQKSVMPIEIFIY